MKGLCKNNGSYFAEEHDQTWFTSCGRGSKLVGRRLAPHMIMDYYLLPGGVGNVEAKQSKANDRQNVPQNSRIWYRSYRPLNLAHSAPTRYPRAPQAALCTCLNTLPPSPSPPMPNPRNRPLTHTRVSAANASCDDSDGFPHPYSSSAPHHGDYNASRGHTYPASYPPCGTHSQKKPTDS